MYDFLKLLHLIGSSVWLGGMILMGAFVPTVRKLDSSGTIIKALANRFGQVGWTAYFIAIFSGLAMFLYGWSFSTLNTYFHIKLGLLLVTGVLTYIHSKATNLEPKFKGMIQGVILLCTFGIFYTAILFTT